MNTENKSKKYDRKSEYATKYVFRERGITIHPPYKNCVLAISLRGKLNTKGTRVESILIKI